jgi:hypothetical protein
MASKKKEKSCLELYDVLKKETVAKVALAEIEYVPRTGERVFIPFRRPKDWSSYTVVAVEYFLGYDPSTGDACDPSGALMINSARLTST